VRTWLAGTVVVTRSCEGTGSSIFFDMLDRRVLWSMGIDRIVREMLAESQNVWDYQLDGKREGGR